jgi:hypothetical protein
MTDSPVIPEMRRQLPSFDDWLTTHGNGKRGDGFEALTDLVRRTLETPDGAHLTDDERSFLRMWKGMCVAVVELSNIEHQHGRTPEQIIQTMPRVLATAAMYSTASVLSGDAPHRSVAKLLTEEFRAAAKASADYLTAAAEREAS